MAQIRRPAVQLPPAPRVYDQREEQEFRRVVARILSESIEDTSQPDATASFTIPQQTASDTLDRYYYSWAVSGHPAGTRYNVVYRYTNTAGSLIEEGTVINATSGGYIQSTGNIGATPFYTLTVNAMNSKQLIDTATGTGTFAT